MRSLQKIIAFALMFVGLSIVVHGANCPGDKELGGCPMAGYLVLVVDELTAKHLAYDRFQSLVANKQIATDTLERVVMVDSNFAGKYLLVKLRNDPEEYRVYKSRTDDNWYMSRLELYHIPTGFSYRCI